MSDLRDKFEKTKVYLRFNENFNVYHTNLGGYHFSSDKKPCYYLNGALEMFQELNK